MVLLNKDGVRYEYTNFMWNLAWFLVWFFGVIAGICLSWIFI